MTSDPALTARKRRHRNERIAASILLLILAAATVRVVQWEKRTTEDLRRDQRYIPGNATITPEIELLQEYVRIDTSTPAGAVAGARWLAQQLEKRGVRAEIISSAPDHLNVYARVRGRTPNKGLLLFSHIDVVPPGSGWTAPPFEARIALNMMWGRGTLDMKAMTICQLLAFTEIARSARAPQHDLVFLATADEETGSEYGMRWLLEHRPDVFSGMRYGITEGGITEVMSDRMTYFGVEVAAKQLVELTLEGPDPGSLQEARFALEPAMFAREPQRVLPVVRRYFHDIAPTRTAYRPFLTDIDATIRRGEFWSLPVAYRDLTQDSLWVSAPARTSGRWQMAVRMSNLPDSNPDERLAWLERVVATHGVRIAEIREKHGPVPVSDFDSALFEILIATAKDRYRVPAGVQVLYRSATDSRFLRQRGIECYGLCPYPVTFYQSATIHGVDERIGLGAFLEGIDYMTEIVGKWARSTP